MRACNFLFLILAISFASHVHCAREDIDVTKEKATGGVNEQIKELGNTILDMIKKKIADDPSTDQQGVLDKYNEEFTKIKDIFRDIVLETANNVINSSVKSSGVTFWSLLIPTVVFFYFLA